MADTLTGRITNGLSVELRHGSGALINTTATKDFGGEGNLFSPTDLFAVSLCSCSLISMAFYAKKNNIPLDSASFTVEKEMKTTLPRRFKKISIIYKVKTNADDSVFKKLIHAAELCPVRQSLHPEIELIEKFERES